MALLGLGDVKTYLRVEPENTAEDGYLQGMITAALRACEQRTGRYLDPAAIPIDSMVLPLTDADLEMVKVAALKLIADWYDTRDGTAQSATIAELPLGVRWLLDPLRDFSAR